MNPDDPDDPNYPDDPDELIDDPDDPEDTEFVQSFFSSLFFLLCIRAEIVFVLLYLWFEKA